MPGKTPLRGRHQPGGLIILYEDKDILVVNKAPGLLTMGTEKERERTAYSRLMDYVRKGNAKSRQRVFIVHRLDREVSGLLVFAKTNEAKMTLQRQWKEAEKKYLAVVHGKMKDAMGTITSYLAENASHVVFSVPDRQKGKLAHTAYRVLKETKAYSLLEITLLTGRKHQIRVHLSETGHPVVGDKKYGKQNKVSGRLALHAHSLTFNHPFSGERIAFEVQIPVYFNKLMGGERHPKSSTEPQE